MIRPRAATVRVLAVPLLLALFDASPTLPQPTPSPAAAPAAAARPSSAPRAELPTPPPAPAAPAMAPAPPRPPRAPRLSGGYLGVELVDLTPDLREHFGAPRDLGVMVGRVEPGSPAARAGLEVADVVTRVGEEPIHDSWELSGEISNREGGAALPLTVVRAGHERRVEATLEQRERDAIDVGRWIFPPKPALPGAPPTPPSAATPPLPPVGPALERLGRMLESNAFQDQIRATQERVDAEVQQRMKELEKRLRELEKRIEEGDRR